MSRELLVVGPAMSLRQIVELVLGKAYRAVPVVEAMRPVGIITNTDLVERGGLGVRLELLRALEEPQLREALDQLQARERTAAEVMTHPPVTVKQTATLPEAAEVMARRRLKRLPVVDDQGELVGMVSRLDLLKAVAGGPATHAPVSPEPGLAGDGPVGRVMRRDAPVVHPETPLPETFQAVISTRLNRTFVVDAEGKVVGLVSDAELLERITPALRTSALRSLMSRLPFVHPKQEAVGAHAHGRTAGDVMSRSFVTVTEDVLLSKAIARMLQEGQKVLGVTDAAGRLLGMVDRADLLHGLLRVG
jgi:CBS domain-containing protein